MPTLDSLRPGERACITDIAGDDAVAIRLMEMGVIEGAEIECVGAAPFGDPVEFALRGYRLSLRISEARRVQIAAALSP